MLFYRSLFSVMFKIENLQDKFGLSVFLLLQEFLESSLLGVPKKQLTRLFESNKKTISLTSLILPFLNFLYYNLNFGILISKIGCKLRNLWLSKVQSC